MEEEEEEDEEKEKKEEKKKKTEKKKKKLLEISGQEITYLVMPRVCLVYWREILVIFPTWEL